MRAYSERLSSFDEENLPTLNRILFRFANAINSNEVYVNIAEFGSIDDTIFKIGSTKITVIVSDARTLSSNTTFPSNITLRILQGGSIVKAATYTLTINGPFEAGLYQVFSGFNAGNVTFGSGSIKKVYSEWWGIDGTADDVQINQALNSISTSKGIVQLLAKTYNLITDLPVPASSVSLQGMGYWATILDVTGDDAITIATTVAHVNIRDLGIRVNTATFSGIKTAGHWVNIERCRIYLNASNTKGIYSNGGFQMNIDKCIVYGAGNTITGCVGIYADSVCQFLNITKNTISYFGGGGIKIAGGTSVPYTFNILNNDIETMLGDNAFAIDLSDCVNIRIEGNTSEIIGEAGDTGCNWIRAGIVHTTTSVTNLRIIGNKCQTSLSTAFKFINLDYVQGFDIGENNLGGATDTSVRLTVTANTVVTPVGVKWLIQRPRMLLDLLPTPQAAPQVGDTDYVDVTGAPTRYMTQSYAYGKMYIRYTSAGADTFSFKFQGDSTPVEVVDTAVGAQTRTAEAEGLFDFSLVGIGELQAKSAAGTNWTVLYAYIIFY